MGIWDWLVGDTPYPVERARYEIQRQNLLAELQHYASLGVLSEPPEVVFQRIDERARAEALTTIYTVNQTFERLAHAELMRLAEAMRA